MFSPNVMIHEFIGTCIIVIRPKWMQFYIDSNFNIICTSFSFRKTVGFDKIV